MKMVYIIPHQKCWRKIQFLRSVKILLSEIMDAKKHKNSPGKGHSKKTRESNTPKNQKNNPQSKNKNLPTPTNGQSGNQKSNQKQQSQNRHGGSGNNNFEEYMSRGEVEQGLNNKSLVEGTLRINPKSYEDAFICSPDGTNDIYIRGVRDRNRALEGDTVIIQLLPGKDWIVNNDAVQDFLDRHGTEEDFALLMEDCKINVKQEINETSTPSKADQEPKQIIEKLEVSVEIDTFNPPGPRPPDIIHIVSKQDSKSGEDDTAAVDTIGGDGTTAAADDKGWGPSSVSNDVSWDTSGVKTYDTLGNALLQDVQRKEGKKARRGARGVKKAKVVAPAEILEAAIPEDGLLEKRITEITDNVGELVVSVAEAAVDLPGHARVNIERDGVKICPADLVGSSDLVVSDFKDDLNKSKDENLIPAEDLVECGESDYESEESITADLEQKIEDEAFRLANMGIDPEKHMAADEAPTETDDDNTNKKEDESSDADVIVECEINGQTGEVTKVDPNEKPKKARRGQRGKKNKPSENEFKPRRQKAREPLVEWNISAVLKHPKCKSFVQRKGKVVAIKDFKHSRVAAGTIKPYQDKNPRFALFSPGDNRVPRIKVPMEDCPPNFLDRPEDYLDMLFVARITEWNMVNSAFGRVLRSLGHGSDIEARTEGMLIEANIDYSEFAEEVNTCLPPSPSTWTIPQDEYSRRRDYRDQCVFTIDPLTARDLDDALSVTLQEDGLYRVGVHIADVGYFVKENTTLDVVARSRGTSTYLVQKVVPMLPRPLCEHLCSLNPGEDRLTFTVEWTMTAMGKIKSEWFGRSVIKSCAKLAYEHAQSMLDEPDRQWTEGQLPQIHSPWTAKDLSSKVGMLQLLAVQLRAARQNSGALRLDQPKLCFTLNPDSGLPDGYKLHEHKHSNKLIEEFMLLANMAVAHKIYSCMPRQAVLRRHPPPKEAMMEHIVEQLASLGISLDSESAGSLATSLANIRQGVQHDEDDDLAVLAAVTALCSKPMELARYFCTGMLDPDEFHHYALNVPLYTHFTSPIRRYPDILVHRLLDMAVTGRKLLWQPFEVERVAQHCNDKKLAAKRVGEASAEMFLAAFVGECGPIPNKAGAVLQVMDHSIDVLILELGVVKRVYVDRLGVESHAYRRVQGVAYLDLKWPDGTKLTLTITRRVTVTLSKGDKPHDFLAVIDKPEAEAKPEIIYVD